MYQQSGLQDGHCDTTQPAFKWNVNYSLESKFQVSTFKSPIPSTAYGDISLTHGNQHVTQTHLPHRPDSTVSKRHKASEWRKKVHVTTQSSATWNISRGREEWGVLSRIVSWLQRHLPCLPAQMADKRLEQKILSFKISAFSSLHTKPQFFLSLKPLIKLWQILQIFPSPLRYKAWNVRQKNESQVHNSATCAWSSLLASLNSSFLLTKLNGLWEEEDWEAWRKYIIANPNHLPRLDSAAGPWVQW